MTRVRTAHTPGGWRIEVSHVVSAPADGAWELLCDTRRWIEWSPTIAGVEATDRHLERGTAGTLRTVGGLRLPFRITDYDPDRRRWSWSVARIPSTGHRVDDLGSGRCRIAFELPVLAAGYVPVCLRGLEQFAELLESVADA